MFVLPWDFYSIKGIHTIIGTTYIDGSFNVGISLIGVFSLFGKYDYFPRWFPRWQGYQTGRLQKHLKSERTLSRRVRRWGLRFE